MTINKITLRYDTAQPETAKIMVYSDKGSDACFLTKETRHWAVGKIWGDNFTDFFRSPEGARLADVLGAAAVFAEYNKYVRFTEWVYDLTSDVFNGIKAFAAAESGE